MDDRNLSDGVCLGIDCVGAKHSGAAAVVVDLLQSALENREVSRVVAFTSPVRTLAFELPTAPKLEVVEQEAAEANPLSRWHWLHRGLPAACTRAGVEALVLLSGGGVPPPGVRSLAFIQQSLPFWPEALRTLSFAQQARMAAIGRAMKHACEAAARVVVQTSTMRQLVGAAFDLPRERFVVLEPSSPPFPPAEPPSPRLEVMRAHAGPRLLYVGNQSPYKNLGALLAGFSALREWVPNAALFGTWPAAYAGEHAGAFGLGPLDRAELREAYGLASMLVMPSLTETVGLPMLEAMSLGVPVLAADRPYAHDVCGDAARYFNPLRPASLAQGAQALLSDAAEQRRLCELGLALMAQRAATRPYARLVELAVSLARGGTGQPRAVRAGSEAGTS